jgi:hypothetical protein
VTEHSKPTPPTEPWLERSVDSAAKEAEALPEYKQRAAAQEFGLAPPAETVGDAVRAATSDVLKAANMSTPPAPTQDQSEREHCFETVTDFMRLFDSLADTLSDGCYEDIESQFSLLLLHERAAARAEGAHEMDGLRNKLAESDLAAADQAGYERGRAEQSEHTATALELGDKAGYERGRAEGQQHRTVFDGTVMLRDIEEAREQLIALQAKYDRLDAAARAYLKAKNSAGANEVLARETELIAALSDQPETSEDKS